MKLRDATIPLRKRGDKALVAFLTAGYPDERTFAELVRAAAAAGSDVIEIGVPFSDPIADGPLIQESSARALEQGMSLGRCIELAAGMSSDVACPLMLMGYVNPILRMGEERFAERAQAAGILGTIIPDVPVEESEHLRAVLATRNLTWVDLIAPTSSDERIERIAERGDGFLYLVSVTGVTGVKSPEAHDLQAFVGRVRKRSDLPLYVGFGINSAQRAKEAVRFADGVIIGSQLIRLIKDAHSREAAVEAVGDFLAGVKAAIQTVGDAGATERARGGR